MRESDIDGLDKIRTSDQTEGPEYSQRGADNCCENERRRDFLSYFAKTVRGATTPIKAMITKR